MAVKRVVRATLRDGRDVGCRSLGGASGAASARASFVRDLQDGTVYRVFTGVVVRVIPNAAHFEIHFVPLNNERDKLVRDEKGEPLVWVVQMESAAQAHRCGPGGGRIQTGNRDSVIRRILRDRRAARRQKHSDRSL